MATLHDDDPHLAKPAGEHGDAARVRRDQPMRLLPTGATTEAWLGMQPPQPAAERQVRALVLA